MAGKGSGRLASGAALIGVMALTGCVEQPLKAPRFSEMFCFGGSQAEVTTVEPEADGRGVIDFGEFAVIVAREGDTIADVANRVALTPDIMARYNGLPQSYRLRAGERLAIPEGGQVAAVEQGWSPAIVTGALDDVNEPSAQAAAAAPDVPGTVPLRHRVEAGETVYSIAALYRVSVTSLASWNGLTGDLAVAPGRSLIIPVAGAPGVVSAAKEPATAEVVKTEPVAAAPAPKATTQPGSTTSVTRPPSADTPLPKNQTAQSPDLKSPDLGQFRTAASGAVKLLTPVDGKVVKPFAKGGSAKNDGIDFQTAASAPVKAAEAGEVALVSRSLGGLGTIILIRHPDDLITVYGRVTDVQVEKGDAVRRGQRLGTVADGTPPTMHFEVRRGTEAVDPTPFL